MVSLIGKLFTLTLNFYPIKWSSIIHCVKSGQIRSFFSGPYFTPNEISVFNPNAGKYGLGKTLYLDIFHSVTSIGRVFRSSCVVENKTLKRESYSWNIQSMDTTKSKTNLVDRNTFTIFLKMSYKASESIEVFCRMNIFFLSPVSFLIFSAFKDYVKIIIRCTSDLLI